MARYFQSNKTRTVIKAKGLSYPNITGKTFAVFRVDQEHHLLSLISVISNIFLLHYYWSVGRQYATTY